MQRAAQKAVDKKLKGNSKLQVALVAVDAQTGEVLAMIGGRDQGCLKVCK